MAQGIADVKVLFVSGTDGDTRRYRCFHQQEQLAMHGVTSGFCESDDPQLLVDALEYDVFILHRVPYTRLISAVIDVAHLRGKPIVFETDDIVFAPELYDEIGFVDTLSPADARQFRLDLRLQSESFQRCDCVLTTTEFLAREARDRGRPSYVNRNAPSEEMIRLSEEAFAVRRREEAPNGRDGDPVVVGYFSGTGSHNRDFRVITAPLIWMLETYPEAWLHIGGHLELDTAFAPYGDRIRRAPYVNWHELPHLIASVDVNLAPLEEDNPFCQAKSENKFVEAALVGIPTIASPVEAFEFAITDGQDGLLASTADEWKAALKMLVTGPERRRQMGEAARRTAYTRYTPSVRASSLVETLQQIIDRYASASASPEQLLHKWAERMKHYATGTREDVLSRDAQVESLRHVIGQYEAQMIEEVRRKRQVIDQKDRVIERKQESIERLEGTIEEIRQGRVMRLMGIWDSWLRGMKREDSP